MVWMWMMVCAGASAGTPEALITLSDADAWHGTAVFYGGSYTDVRKAWELLEKKATDDELLDWVVNHKARGVRYGSLRILEKRGLTAQIDKKALRDKATLDVCPGGCRCLEESVGSRLLAIREGSTLHW